MEPPASSRRARPVWLTAPVLTVSVLSVASGIAAFGVTTVIGDVAAAFGEQGAGDDFVDQVGVPGSTLAAALAIVRLSSLGSLVGATLADRLGRRRVLIAVAALGLGFTSLAALAPGFWWYVALVAIARPALSTLNAVAGVVAAEEARSKGRSAAIALIAAAYGLGSGIVSVGRGLLPGEPSFRVVTAFALVPLLLLPVLVRRIREPQIAQDHIVDRGLPGLVPRRLVVPVLLLALLTGGIALATGPGFTYLFVYGESVLGASPLFLSMLVLGAGPAGLFGILVGRAGADHLGRRITGGIAMAATGAAVAYAYTGSIQELAVGYLLAIAASSAFAPSSGALAAELVPTRVRSTVAGWMTVSGVLGAVTGLWTFGRLADLTGGFAAAAQWIGVAVALTAALFLFLPETRGRELESLEDDPAN